MPSPSSKLSRGALLSRYFPHYHVTAPPASAGLSGGSCIIARGGYRLVLRQHHDAAAPESHFRRQYRALRSLPASLAPRALGYYPGWMAVEYLPGEIPDALPAARELTALLLHLHRRPRFGWRIALLPLLEHYWQYSSPARRFPRWLRMLKRLRRRGEPQPLRLAPLHMDVHAGNIVRGAQGLRLIDWEYAGDGDIALELASVWTQNEQQRRALLAEYTRQASLEQGTLARQVRRWRPWVLMLMAGWYEYRWAQTGDRQFIALADDGWRQLTLKK